MRRICRTAGHGIQKYAIEISLISVAIGGTGFITEAILAVEYIQATRLALIQAHPGVAFILFLMSFVKCKYRIHRVETIRSLRIGYFQQMIVNFFRVIVCIPTNDCCNIAI